MRLLSRNAEALFWLARYLERGASLARVIEMQSSFGAHDQEQGWSWLLALHSDEERFKELFEVSSRNITAFYVTDLSNPGSVRSSIHWARENARALRPFIPIEMWVQLNAFHGSVEALAVDDISLSQLPRTCAVIRAGCLAQIGIAEGTLFRDEGYQFFKLGLLVERADQTSRLLDVKFAQATTGTKTRDLSDDFVFWSTILRTAAAYQVFHRLESQSADLERVSRFLIFNPSHPRSLGFCVREISESLHTLRHSFRLSRANKCLEECEVMMEGLHEMGRHPALAEHLHDFNNWVQTSLGTLTDTLSTAFFTRSRPDAPQADATQTQTQTQTQAQSQTQGQTQNQSAEPAAALQKQNQDQS